LTVGLAPRHQFNIDGNHLLSGWVAYERAKVYRDSSYQRVTSFTMCGFAGPGGDTCSGTSAQTPELRRASDLPRLRWQCKQWKNFNNSASRNPFDLGLA